MAPRTIWHVTRNTICITYGHVHYHVKHFCITHLKICPFMSNIMWIIVSLAYAVLITFQNHRQLQLFCWCRLVPCMHIINFSATGQRGHYFWANTSTRIVDIDLDHLGFAWLGRTILDIRQHLLSIHISEMKKGSRNILPTLRPGAEQNSDTAFSTV